MWRYHPEFKELVDNIIPPCRYPAYQCILKHSNRKTQRRPLDLANYDLIITLYMNLLYFKE